MDLKVQSHVSVFARRKTKNYGSERDSFSLIIFCFRCAKTMETRYKETNLFWPYFTKHEMNFCQVHNYKTSRWGHVCSLSAKWRHPRFISIVYWASPFYTQGTHMPSSGSFVIMYLAELHFRNEYMKIGLLISILHGKNADMALTSPLHLSQNARNPQNENVTRIDRGR